MNRLVMNMMLGVVGSDSGSSYYIEYKGDELTDKNTDGWISEYTLIDKNEYEGGKPGGGRLYLNTDKEDWNRLGKRIWQTEIPLETFDLSESGITYIEGATALLGNIPTQELILPKTNFVMGKAKDTNIGAICLYNVRNIVVPASDYSPSSAGGAFRGCSRLEELTIPFISSNNGSETNLGFLFGSSYENWKGSARVLQYAENPKDHEPDERPVYLPPELHSIKVTGTTIERYSFSGLTSFGSRIMDIHLLNAEVINDYAFYGANKLRLHIYTETPPTLNGNQVFANISTIDLLVPQSAYSTYVNDPVWGTIFAGRIEPIK